MIGGKGQVYPKKCIASKNLEAPFRAHRGRLEGVLMESLDIQWQEEVGRDAPNGKVFAMTKFEIEESASCYTMFRGCKKGL